MKSQLLLHQLQFLDLNIVTRNIFISFYKVDSDTHLNKYFKKLFNASKFQTFASNEFAVILRSLLFTNSRPSLISTKNVGKRPLPLTLISPRNVHLMPKLVRTFAVSSVTCGAQ